MVAGVNGFTKAEQRVIGAQIKRYERVIGDIVKKSASGQKQTGEQWLEGVLAPSVQNNQRNGIVIKANGQVDPKFWSQMLNENAGFFE